MLNFDAPAKKNAILVPKEFDDIANEYFGGLYGYIREDTGVCVVLGWDENKPDKALQAGQIGCVNAKPCELDHWEEMDKMIRSGIHFSGGGDPWVHGVKNVNGVEYRGPHGSNVLQKEVYSVTQDLFSRNLGLLETDRMKEKTILLVGCGSVGSTLALQLARSGVGKFILVDTDTVEIHNICRHQCNLTDVGRYKTNALRDRIISINPSASVTCFNKIIQNVTNKELDGILDDQSIVVGCSDNRLAKAFSCELAFERNIPFVAIGFWTRAFVCEMALSNNSRV